MDSNKRKLILKSLQPKKYIKTTNINNYDTDEDDNNEEVVNDAIENASTQSRSGSDTSLVLPGGSAISQEPYNSRCIGSGVGEAPREVVKNIRKYMDILLNSALLEAKYLTSSEMNQANSMLAIPGVVSAILEYNNISFKTIKYCTTRIDLFESVWYTYNITKNELILYINEQMYTEFCSKNSNDPVIFTSGIIPIEIFNPYESNPNIDSVSLPIIHCAIVSDHVAQHIISDLYCPDKVSCADIHDKFCDYGTTLHSMFHLEQTFVKMPTREYSNYLTLSTSSAPLMRSTQRLIDSIIPPSTSLGLNSLSYQI